MAPHNDINIGSSSASRAERASSTICNPATSQDGRVDAERVPLEGSQVCLSSEIKDKGPVFAYIGAQFESNPSKENYSLLEKDL